ncbi:MAG: class I SAM-dependent methyltransferase [Marmoricola sp.]
MTREFDKDFWAEHWAQAPGAEGAAGDLPPNPYLQRATRDLSPGTALDAGCGEGAEAIWLASAGWQVTAADISAEALARAAARAVRSGVAEAVRWTEADLSTWVPDTQFSLVTTHYAHPAMPQLAFYDRISEWVAPGGTLLIVAHRHTTDGPDHGHGHGGHGDQPPTEASVTADSVVARLDDETWEVVTAHEPDRTLPERGGRPVTLQDVVVRATRRP